MPYMFDAGSGEADGVPIVEDAELVDELPSERYGGAVSIEDDAEVVVGEGLTPETKNQY